MKLPTLVCLFVLLRPLSGHADAPDPYRASVPEEVTSRLQRIAVVSTAARTLYKVEFAMPSARHEQKDISAWGIDDIFEQQLVAEVQNTLGLAAVSTSLSMPDLPVVNETSQLTRPDWSVIREAVLSHCSANSLDAVLVVNRDNSNFLANTGLILPAGTGLYVRGGKSMLYLTSSITLIDCKTGEPVAARYVVPPEHTLAQDMANLGIAQWSDQQSQTIKAGLVSLPKPAWAQAMRSMFLSYEQQAELNEVEKVVTLIKRTYIDDVPDARLAEGCRGRIARELKPGPGAIQPLFPEAFRANPTTQNALGILSAIRRQSPQSYRDNKLAKACVKGMIDVLAPRNAALMEYGDSEQFTADEAAGHIGIHFKLDDGTARIVTVYEDTQAEKAGLKVGDTIIRIDSVETRGRTLREIARSIRGAEGTTVRLAVQREGIKDLMEFTLIRDTFGVHSVKWQTLAPGFVYVRISEFDSSTTPMLIGTMRDAYLENGGRLKGLVLDLRNNQGGLLTGSIGVAAAFLPAGALVVNTAGREAGSNERFSTSPEDYMHLYGGKSADRLKRLPEGVRTVPLAVLVNETTASGAEVLAAALQDHKRAQVIGMRTNGMATVATVTGLFFNMALKLTTGELHRPNGKTIHGVGVTPDVKVEAPNLTPSGFRTADDIQLMQAVKRLGGKVLTFRERTGT